MDLEESVKQVWSEKAIENKAQRVDEETDIQWPFIVKTVEEYTKKKHLKKKDICILDSGTGNGIYSEVLIRHGYTNIQAMDLFEENVFRQSGINCEYFQGSHTAIPREDNTYDVIICCGSLYYLDDPEKGLIEFKRVLKNGGVLFFSVVTKYSLTTLDRVVRKFLGKASVSHIEYYHFKYSIFSYRKWLRRQGYDIDWIDGINCWTLRDEFKKRMCRLANKALKKDLRYIKRTKIARNKQVGFLHAIYRYHAVVICSKKEKK